MDANLWQHIIEPLWRGVVEESIRDIMYEYKGHQLHENLRPFLLVSPLELQHPAVTAKPYRRELICYYNKLYIDSLGRAVLSKKEGDA